MNIENNFDMRYIFLAAVDRSIGHHSIGAACFAKEIAKNWKLLPDDYKIIIKRKIKAYFERDEAAAIADQIDVEYWRDVIQIIENEENKKLEIKVYKYGK